MPHFLMSIPLQKFLPSRPAQCQPISLNTILNHNLIGEDLTNSRKNDAIKVNKLCESNLTRPEVSEGDPQERQLCKDVTSLIQEVRRYLNFKLEIQNYLEQVYQHPRNVSIKIQKDISSRAGDTYS